MIRFVLALTLLCTQVPPVQDCPKEKPAVSLSDIAYTTGWYMRRDCKPVFIIKSPFTDEQYYSQDMFDAVPHAYRKNGTMPGSTKDYDLVRKMLPGEKFDTVKPWTLTTMPSEVRAVHKTSGTGVVFKPLNETQVFIPGGGATTYVEISKSYEQTDGKPCGTLVTIEVE